MGLVDDLKRKIRELGGGDDSIPPATAAPAPGQANLPPLDPNTTKDHGYRVISEEQAAKEAASPGLMDRIFKRDIKPAPKATEQQTKQPDQAAQQQQQADAQSAQASGTRVEAPDWVDRDIPQPPTPSGGGTGMSDREAARMAAGGSPLSKEQTELADTAKGIYDDAADDARKRGRAMQFAIDSNQEARANIRKQQLEDEKELREQLAKRSEDEAAIRTALRQRADIDPSAYFKKHPVGEVGAKALAGVGGFFSALAGPEWARIYSDNLNKRISEGIETQVASFNNNLGLSREVRQQWQDRVATLGDIHKAKLSAQMQDLEAASDLFKAQAELQKNDQVRNNLLVAANAIDMKLADTKQNFDMEVEKGTIRERKQRAAAGAAIAERRYQEWRQDTAEQRKAQLDIAKTDALLGGREDVARLRGAGKGGAADERKTRAEAEGINKEYQKLAPVEEALRRYEEARQRVDPKKIGRITGFFANRGMSSEKAQLAAEALAGSKEEVELIRARNGLQQAVLRAEGGKALPKQEIDLYRSTSGGAGISEGDVEAPYHVAKGYYQTKSESANRLGNEQAQAEAAKWRKAASDRNRADRESNQSQRDSDRSKK